MAARATIYPLGFVALALLDTLFTQWAVYFHTEGAEATATSARFVGVALLGGYALQSALNPLLGAASDGLRHRWGRRRPFVLAGAPVLAIAFAGVWQVGGVAGLALIPLYCAAFTLVAQPYTTLLPTIAPVEATRVRLMLIGSMLGFTASGAALVGGPAILEVGSFASLGVIGFTAAWLFLFVPALLLREPPAAREAAPAREPFFASAKQLVAQRPVRRFLVGNMCLFAGVGLLTMISPFIPEALIGRERSYTAVLNAWLFGGMMAALPVMVRIGGRVHPASIMAAGALAGAAVLGVMSAAVLGGASALWLWWLGYLLLGATVLLALAGPSLVLSRLAERDGRGREGLLFGLNGAIAIGLGRAIAALAMGALFGGLVPVSSATGALSSMVVAGSLFAGAAWLLAASARPDDKIDV